MTVQQKGSSSAYTLCGSDGRHGHEGPVGNRVGPWFRVQTLERLREQIRCIEGRVPTLEPEIRNVEPSARCDPRSTGFDREAGDGCPSRRHNNAQGVSSGAPQQTGLPADRFVDEDGCVVFPTHTPAMQPSSSFSSRTSLPCSSPSWSPSLAWTLGRRPVAGSGAGEGRRAAPFILDQIELDVAGVHEIKPAFACGGERGGGGEDWAAGWAAALAFATALMARRLHGLRAADDGSGRISGRVEPAGQESVGMLWCLSRSRRAEHGLPYVHGLEALGLSAGQVMIAEAGNTAETLWALEEGICSGAPVLVAGIVDDLAITPARRLALAARKHGVPCLMLTDPRAPPAAATATRWRVGPAPSGTHPLVAGQQGGQVLRLPGPRRFALTLERCRQGPAQAGSRVHFVEWRHEAVCFDLVTAVSDRPAAARETRTGAIG